MYPEFVPIYVGLVVIVILQVITLVKLFKGTKKTGLNIPAKAFPVKKEKTQPQQEPISVVFCKSCATQFDSSQKACPKCGTQR